MMKVNSLVNKNYQSTGNLFLDQLIGGFSIGTIVLMIEDSPTKIYESFLKYFMAEGIVKNQKVFLYTTNPTTKQNLSNLPYKSTQVDNILNTKKPDTKQGEIKIAWRYENIKYSNVIEDILKSTDYIFDLSRTLQDEYLKGTQNQNQSNFTTTNIEAKSGSETLKQLIHNLIRLYQLYFQSARRRN